MDWAQVASTSNVGLCPQDQSARHVTTPIRSLLSYTTLGSGHRLPLCLGNSFPAEFLAREWIRAVELPFNCNPVVLTSQVLTWLVTLFVHTYNRVCAMQTTIIKSRNLEHTVEFQPQITQSPGL
ncbi:hypothetical protein CEXT_16311 [Caerostris extrusa]|uniref:Uncharacterized protein n=1 Tax=Caerostris extrusa TaxID=172846 RepID=A0AAV4MDR8_CAEEX|nr:hypothetical protein CEXT_16311 [Caerostris extrusa]